MYHELPKNPYIPRFLHSILGPDYYGPRGTQKPIYTPISTQHIKSWLLCTTRYQKNIYTPISTQHIRSWLLCTPVITPWHEVPCKGKGVLGRVCSLGYPSTLPGWNIRKDTIYLPTLPLPSTHPSCTAIFMFFGTIYWGSRVAFW